MFLPSTYPLRKLTCKHQKFYWSTDCQKAFVKLKNEIFSDRVLVPYNPELPVTLATDASPVGIAPVLSATQKCLTALYRNFSKTLKR